MKKGVLIVLVFGAAFLAIMIYSTMGLREYRVEVCVEFNGQQNCRTASGSTREDAQRAATDNACALIANGMTESMACTARPPRNVTWLDE